MEVNKVFNDDCLNIFKVIENDSIDLVITDPPYKKVQGGCTNHAVKLTGATKEDMSSGKFFKENIIGFNEWIPEV